MSECEKHKSRKRKDCPDCFPELHAKTPEASKDADVEIVIDKLWENKPNTIVSTPISDANLLYEMCQETLKEPEPIVNLDDYYNFKHAEIIKIADDVVAKKIKEITKEINSIISIKHESLDVPLARFNMKVLDILLNDGWKLISFLTKDVAKASGLKEDSAILQRVRCDSWKKTQEQYKQIYKDQK